MTNSEIINAAFAALESDNPQSAAQFFADDLIWIGTFPLILDKYKFLQMMMAVKKSFPDYSMNIKICQEINDRTIKATMEPSGTHAGTFALAGLTPIKATGRTVALVKQAMEFTLSGEKISRVKVEHASGGGIMGLLESLGVEVTEELLEKMFR